MLTRFFVAVCLCSYLVACDSTSKLSREEQVRLAVSNFITGIKSKDINQVNSVCSNGGEAKYKLNINRCPLENFPNVCDELTFPNDYTAKAVLKNSDSDVTEVGVVYLLLIDNEWKVSSYRL